MPQSNAERALELIRVLHQKVGNMDATSDIEDTDANLNYIYAELRQIQDLLAGRTRRERESEGRG